ncbi:hypothetical protein [Brachybacterium sp. UNK5269]|uniref:hypothetical protein n=1 Tax=Brachybacterium sp. UNK5269 TaxID=3408576 RepID=UPI003BAEF92F
MLISAGIGVTPMLGMLRHLAATQPEREVRVLHADAHAADAALVHELAETVASLPKDGPSRLDLWFSGSVDGAPVTPGHACCRVSGGRMEITAEHLPDGAEMYLCGSSTFLQSAREQLRRAGAGDERVHFELFSPNDWLLPGC